MTDHEASGTAIGPTMRAVRLLSPGGPGALVLEEIAVPEPAPGEALVRVHAAALTKDELEWPEDRLPAIPSYEVSGTVAAVAADVETVSVGDAVYALTDFGRDGAAADFAAVAVELLAPKPRALDDVQSAAIPLPGLSAWQGLFDHGGLEAGQRVLITGAAGGVGHLATQLARHRGAHVIGTASPASRDAARGFGAHEVIDGSDSGIARAGRSGVRHRGRSDARSVAGRDPAGRAAGVGGRGDPGDRARGEDRDVVLRGRTEPRTTCRTVPARGVG